MTLDYRDDPAWLEARARWTAEYPVLSPDVAAVVRLKAIFELYNIERSYRTA